MTQEAGALTLTLTIIFQNLSSGSFIATGRGAMLDCRLTSLCLQLHYSYTLRVGHRELRRCITFGNYHVKPQSRKARLWLVLFISQISQKSTHDCQSSPVRHKVRK